MGVFRLGFDFLAFGLLHRFQPLFPEGNGIIGIETSKGEYPRADNISFNFQQTARACLSSFREVLEAHPEGSIQRISNERSNNERDWVEYGADSVNGDRDDAGEQYRALRERFNVMRQNQMAELMCQKNGKPRGLFGRWRDMVG